jgi:hypothetical protein
MKGLLDFILDGSEIYLYERDFKGIQYLWWQISVIKSLQAKEITVAKEHWRELQKVMPHVYGEDFNYLGGVCLFKIALSKVNVHKTSLVVNLPKFETKEELLMFILEEYPSGILKDDLYKMIYGKEVQDKDDYGKLKTLIKRIRKKMFSDIKSRKGSYYISQNSKKVS